MTDRVAEVLPMQALSEEADVSKLSGKTGVFVGGEDDLAAARHRWNAMQAIKNGTETLEQRQLLNDLDAVLQRKAPVREYRPPPVPSYAPTPRPRPQVARGMPSGVPLPPRHSRNR